MLKLPQLVRDAVAAETARLRAGLLDAAIGLILLAVGALIALIGAVFLFIGAYGSLSQAFPAWQAGAIVALAVLVLAGLIVLAGRRRLRGRRSQDRPESLDDSAVAAEIRRATEQGIGAGESLARSGPTAFDLTLAAFIAGLVASRSNRGRRGRSGGAR